MSEYDKEIKGKLEAKIKCITGKSLVISPNHIKNTKDKAYAHSFLNVGIPYSGPAEYRNISKEKWVSGKSFI